MDFDFDGQFGRVKSLSEQQHTVKPTDCYCYIDDTFEQLSARWGKGGAAAYARQKAKERKAAKEREKED